MSSVVYQELHRDVTYSLLCRVIDGILVYDIEVESFNEGKKSTETFKAVSTDCQTSMLLLELLIRGDISCSVSIPSILTKSESCDICPSLTL